MLLLLPPQGPTAKAVIALFPSSPPPPMEQAVEPMREQTGTYTWVDAKEQSWWVSGMEIAELTHYSSGLGCSPLIHSQYLLHVTSTFITSKILVLCWQSQYFSNPYLLSYFLLVLNLFFKTGYYWQLFLHCYLYSKQVGLTDTLTLLVEVNWVPKSLLSKNFSFIHLFSFGQAATQQRREQWSFRNLLEKFVFKTKFLKG